jgi:hypothetical protein
MQDLVPSHHVLAVLLQNLEQPLVEINLQPVRPIQLMLFRERLDSFRILPLLPVHLIAANMHVRIGKQRRHLAKERIQKLICLLARRIHDVVEDPPRALDPRRPFHTHQLGISRKPARRVPRHIKLRDHANAAIPGVRNHLPDLILRVVMAVRTEFLQLRESFALRTESLILRQVPVQHVHLNCSHRVQIAQNHWKRYPVPRDIDHQPTPRKSRPVLDMHRGSLKPVRPRSNQLQKGLEPMQRTSARPSFQNRSGRRYIQRVRLVLAK